MSAMTVNKKMIGHIGENHPYWVSDIVRITATGSKNRYVQYWTDTLDARYEYGETGAGTSLCVRRN